MLLKEFKAWINITLRFHLILINFNPSYVMMMVPMLMWVKLLVHFCHFLLFDYLFQRLKIAIFSSVQKVGVLLVDFVYLASICEYGLKLLNQFIFFCFVICMSPLVLDKKLDDFVKIGLFKRYQIMRSMAEYFQQPFHRHGSRTVSAVVDHLYCQICGCFLSISKNFML